tara:strand:+ start:8168 stop:8302 length:135 start_codon:yes stop_codon:yes gene_type:complete
VAGAVEVYVLWTDPHTHHRASDLSVDELNGEVLHVLILSGAKPS